jgi:Archaeal holliday junction resolvase (hjc)
VGRSASAYERELKELLQGDRDALFRYGRALDPTQRPTLERIAQRPFLVVRAAGSLGFDLVALRSEFAFPLEVKASSSDTIRFSAASGRAGEQLEAHRRAVDRVGLIVLYAYRRVGHRAGDPWRMFAAASAQSGGRLDVLRRRLPPLDRTREGNAVLRWESGMPLLEFMDLVSFLTERRPVAT